MTDPLLCRLCNKPRRAATKRTKVVGLCQTCAASIATVSRTRKTPARTEAIRKTNHRSWSYASETAAAKAARVAPSSWWLEPDTFKAEAEKAAGRMKGNGWTVDNARPWSDYS